MSNKRIFLRLWTWIRIVNLKKTYLAAGILARSSSENVDFDLMPIQFGAAIGKLFGEHNRLLVTTLLKEAIFSLNCVFFLWADNLKILQLLSFIRDSFPC